MKEGDILICKKDIIFNGYSYTKNKHYTISSIDINNYVVFITHTNNYNIGMWFYYYNKPHTWQLFDYFYTQDELRQFKLNTL